MDDFNGEINLENLLFLVQLMNKENRLLHKECSGAPNG